jgi:RHS repeat-associated protein
VNYVWDGQNVLIEANASNAIQAVHTLEPRYYGNQVSQRRSGVTSYYHFDALGSTLQLTGAAGTATDSYVYRAFGDLAASSGSTVNPYQYVGRKGYIYDSDLFNHQVRARRYAPGMGRWWSRDPIGFAGGDADLYRYVGNSPLAGVDPSGERGAAKAHPYPFFLGGSPDQWTFGVTEAQHQAMHRYLADLGYDYHGPGVAEAARAKWAKLTRPAQRRIIMGSLRAGGIPEAEIKATIGRIMKGATPGVMQVRPPGPPKWIWKGFWGGLSSAQYRSFSIILARPKRLSPNGGGAGLRPAKALRPSVCVRNSLKP